MASMQLQQAIEADPSLLQRLFENPDSAAQELAAKGIVLTDEEIASLGQSQPAVAASAVSPLANSIAGAPFKGTGQPAIGQPGASNPASLQGLAQAPQAGTQGLPEIAGATPPAPMDNDLGSVLAALAAPTQGPMYSAPGAPAPRPGNVQPGDIMGLLQMLQQGPQGVVPTFGPGLGNLIRG